MSGGIAPSKSTVYLSNMPFSLTNNDLHKVLTKYGTVVKVTVVKDKITRRSKGYAFAQYLRKEEADACVAELNNTVLFGRTVKSSIAIDNGRSAEFIRRRVYADKSFCYECGVEGHLSYQCPKNSLGERPVPNKKKQKRKKERELERGGKEEDWEEKNNASDDEIEEADLETLSSAIHFEQMKHANRGNHEEHSVKRKKYSRNAYFSDEEDISD